METNKQTILIVDDDPDMQQLLQQVLQVAGYEVLCADNANDGLRLALSRAPVLAILDIQMPEVTGLTLAKSLVEETAVPFVFFTSTGRQDEVMQATRLGAIGYLTKPINPDQIIPFVSVSMVRARDLQQMKAKAETARAIGAAIGLLMAKHPINESQAFQRLHDHARAKRAKIIDVARAMVSAQENINLM
jgi:DNA-binding response OmpR family regulator